MKYQSSSNSRTEFLGVRSLSNAQFVKGSQSPISSTIVFKNNPNIVPLPDRNGLQNREKEWVQNFHMMFSKDNNNYPKMKRELFENPILYDINGTKMQVPHPYGWDMLENEKAQLPNSPKSKCTKISAINTIAFSNYVTSTQMIRRPYGALEPLSPQPSSKGKTTQYYRDHLVVCH
jgi:hypothetical protein